MAFQKPRSLSIIVPVYNEEKTLLPLLKKVQAVKLWGLKKQIIIVNDGSTDKTPLLLKKLKIPGSKILQHDKNRGKGAAIRTAIPHTTGDIVIIQDADLEYDPTDYKTVLAPILDGSADVVYGSRFKGVHRAFLFWHYVGNKFLTFLTNLLYDTVLTDMETCYKAFRGEIIRSLRLRSNRFDFEPEVTAKVLKRGCKLFEVPISFHGRGFEEGKKITWRDGIVALYCLIRYRFMD
ncbi:MAG TPA: glycosyltransferase family 2 protein [bacterium]|jgi:glycosyltransferase involved in cell wall biosynthesis|nr:glycosyltransferase family 2 protein [bacterium]